ncbi:MAG: glycosyltransferase family 2 protein [Candidatus Falkowbacteria bacterium]|nr:glycosyltransferase family 2 protein [Candidatus Falkowbacteria bacterium]
MKLSFVIPAYNEEKYIGQCLQSIFKEAEGKNYDLEIIVVNNASTDLTKEIALSFPGVRVVDEPRKGLVQARSAGYRVAQGDLIANIDADTRLTPHWIDKVLAEFTDPQVVAFSGPFVCYDMPLWINIITRIFYFFAYLTYLFNRFILRISSMLQGGNFVIRKSAFEQVGGYNHNFDFYGEDTDVARRLHKVGKVVFSFYLPMYTSGRRVREEGVFKTAFLYSINYFWTIFFKKPFNKKYKDVRL